MLRRLPCAAILLLIGCEGCGSSSSIPPAITAIAQHREVEPWSGWSIPGVTLYRISFAVPDRSESSIVGLDDTTGEVVRGPELMRRIGSAPPEVLAQRVFDVLLGHQGSRALTRDDRGELGTDVEWAEVEPAHMHETDLVFFAWRGEMAPQLVEHRVSTTEWTVTTRTVTDVIVASGRRVAIGGPRCLPRSVCGCWQGCAAFQLVRLPDRRADESVFVVVREEEGHTFTARRDCTQVEGRERCARICAMDSPDASCEDAVLPEAEACSEACPPSEAFYHCDLYETGCRVVEHPIRRAAAGR